LDALQFTLDTLSAGSLCVFSPLSQAGQWLQTGALHPAQLADKHNNSLCPPVILREHADTKLSARNGDQEAREQKRKISANHSGKCVPVVFYDLSLVLLLSAHLAHNFCRPVGAMRQPLARPKQQTSGQREGATSGRLECVEVGRRSRATVATWRPNFLQEQAATVSGHFGGQ